ncbi:MAG: recombination protein O N-terminal domain-containing protein, partial [Muribaculaceae bacterium]|nr:recombination protein O N-terminal domain-containing protein [Muribaculaceae bacterium]
MNLTCIALRTTRYSDRYDILAAYSREIGRVSLLVPAGSG